VAAVAAEEVEVEEAEAEAEAVYADEPCGAAAGSSREASTGSGASCVFVKPWSSSPPRAWRVWRAAPELSSIAASRAFSGQGWERWRRGAVRLPVAQRDRALRWASVPRARGERARHRQVRRPAWPLRADARRFL